MRKNRISTVAVLAAAAVLIIVIALIRYQDTQTYEDVSVEPESQAMEMYVEWRGKTYTYNNSLINLLFLGVDTTDLIETETVPGEAGQSDCMMLLSLDPETKQGTIIQINRNSMMNLDVYDFSGNYQKSVYAQLTLQYAYSIGGKYSCRAVRDKVSELLYGVTIDGYLAMQVDGISEINDSFGGVDVTPTEDWTVIDPSFTEGSTVHLEGDLAESFVRYRDITEFNSVQGRMERQVQYVTALISKMRSFGGEAFYDTISPYIGDYILTDMDADEINALATYEYLTDDVQYLPGEEVVNGDYEEFYVDEDELQDLVISIFYTEVEDSAAE